jgi:hypothetical protein
MRPLLTRRAAPASSTERGRAARAGRNEPRDSTGPPGIFERAGGAAGWGGMGIQLV